MGRNACIASVVVVDVYSYLFLTTLVMLNHEAYSSKTMVGQDPWSATTTVSGIVLASALRP